MQRSGGTHGQRHHRHITTTITTYTTATNTTATSSTTAVQLSVQISGSQWPVASLKGQMRPVGSMMGLLDGPKSVPEVPSDKTICPGLRGWVEGVGD